MLSKEEMILKQTPTFGTILQIIIDNSTSSVCFVCQKYEINSFDKHLQSYCIKNDSDIKCPIMYSNEIHSTLYLKTCMRNKQYITLRNKLGG